MVIPSQNFMLETINIKVHIVISGKNINCQTKPKARNVFTNIICRTTITGFVTGRRQKELYRYHKLKTYAPFDLNERDVYAAY